jgi:hypothetical protein
MLSHASPRIVQRNLTNVRNNLRNAFLGENRISAYCFFAKSVDGRIDIRHVYLVLVAH